MIDITADSVFQETFDISLRYCVLDMIYKRDADDLETWDMLYEILILEYL